MTFVRSTRGLFRCGIGGRGAGCFVKLRLRAACVKATSYNMRLNHYTVHVLKDCITSYDKRKIEEMLRYCESKGCEILSLTDLA